MANFTELKAYIRSYIYENHLNDITGEELQGVLIEMVEKMGDDVINEIAQDIADEITARQNAVSAEAEARALADTQLDQKIYAEEQARIGAVHGLEQALQTEQSARAAADQTLDGKINAEEQARIGAVHGLEQTIQTEQSARSAADQTLDDKIGAEELARIGAVRGLEQALQTEQSVRSADILSLNTFLNSGYLFIGVAATNTNPGTPDRNIFYLTSQTGTFTNFKDSENQPISFETSGIRVLYFSTDDAWQYSNIILIEDKPNANSNSLVKSGGVDAAIRSMVGYLVCTTEGATAAKIITGSFYILQQGGSLKVKFTYKNTADDATLKIGDAEAQPLYYAGRRAGSSNSWEAGEVVEIFYDGTNYYANNVMGGGAGDGAFDISVYNAVEGTPTKYADLEAALGTNGANIPQSLRKGGISVKFVHSSDNKYVQYRYTLQYAGNTTSENNKFKNTANWQGVTTEIKAGSKDLVESGGVKQQMSFTMESGAYSGGVEIGESTIPAKSTNVNLECLLVQGLQGDKFVVQGRISSSITRLWYVYDANKLLTRVADLNADTIANPVTIELQENERYLAVTAMKSYTHSIAYTNLSGSIELNEKRITENIDAVNDLNNYVDGVVCYTLINGAYVGGSTVGTSTMPDMTYSDTYCCVKIAGKSGDKINIIGVGGTSIKFWYVYNTDGILTRVADANAGTISPLTITFGEGEKYLCVNTLKNRAHKVWMLRLPEKIGTLQNEIDRIKDAEDINLENTGVQIYGKVKYNNNDYSYSHFDYVTDAVATGADLPNPVALGTLVDPSAVTREIQIADNSAFETPLTIALDLVSNQVIVYNLEPDKMYYYRVYQNGSTSSILNTGRFNTCGSVRVLKIDASADFTKAYITNVRDIGGWNTENHTKTRYGCIFRGYELNHTEDGVETVYISDTGKNELLRLGVSAELDLRGEPSVYTESVLGNDVAYYNIGLDLWFYRLNIYNTITDQVVKQATAIRKVLEWLEDGKGIYIHCQGGCDRTGALCAMIEGLCGVSENDINHDYELSGRYRNREYYTIAGGASYDGDFKFAIEYIKGLIEYNSHIYVYYRNNYYDAEAVVTDYTPVPLTDASLIANLAANNYGSLQKRFERLLVGVGGLTMNEVERLRNVLCT